MTTASAGYDCAKGDKIGRFEVEDFESIARILLCTAPKAVFVLEGGYELDDAVAEPHKALCDGVVATLDGMLAGPSECTDQWQQHQGQVRAETRKVIGTVLERMEQMGWWQANV